MKKMTKIFLLSVIMSLFTASTWASAFFSGIAGGKVNYTTDKTSPTYNPDLTLQAYFRGQFNFSQNMWSHFEFTIQTEDFLNEKLFETTTSEFKIDELSLIFRGNGNSVANYFSIFMGTYDPIGSDIFLQRYFSIQPIASKLSESWLGLTGSILYPHFGVGLSNVIRFYNQPLALGIYAYVNHENLIYFNSEKYFVANFDMRFSSVYRFLTFDLAAGIGIPLNNKYKGEEAFVVIDKVYWHAGTTILLGNNYTQSLYMQAGIFNVPFTKKSSTLSLNIESIYLLCEPRFMVNNVHFNISAFSLPKETVEQLMFVENTLGLSFNIYSDVLSFGSKEASFGTMFSISFPDKNFMDIPNILTFLKNKEFDIDFTPYFSTNFLSGDLHILTKIKILDLASNRWFDAFNVDIGYKTSF